MILLVDIGNSRIKWAAYKSGYLCYLEILDHTKLGWNSFMMYQIISHPAWIIDGVYLSSVGPSRIRDEVIFTLNFFVQEEIITAPLELIDQQSEYANHINGYTNPCKLGVDRWLAMLGARTFLNDNMLVVDAGTAITVDAVDQNGRHLGGYILPGLQKLVSSMQTTLAELTLESDSNNEFGFATNTNEAFNRGIALLFKSFFESSQLSESFDSPPTLVFTGGDGLLLCKLIDTNRLYLPDLVLHGLLYVALQEKQKRSTREKLKIY